MEERKKSTGKPVSKKNDVGSRPVPKKKADEKPWEKMHQGKPDRKQSASDKPVSGKKAQAPEKKAETPGKKVEKPAKKVVREERDFLYLLPKRFSAKELARALSFLDRKAVEVWDEDCILEISTENGTITFEDIRETLEKEDKEVLSGLRMKQVLSCDYESTDAETVKQVMEALLKAFGGKIGSDTVDFEPFLTTKDL